jgi:hypothetical protein
MASGRELWVSLCADRPRSRIEAAIGHDLDAEADDADVEGPQASPSGGEEPRDACASDQPRLSFACRIFQRYGCGDCSAPLRRGFFLNREKFGGLPRGRSRRFGYAGTAQSVCTAADTGRKSRVPLTDAKCQNRPQAVAANTARGTLPGTYSMTSSARASSVKGTSRGPSATNEDLIRDRYVEQFSFTRLHLGRRREGSRPQTE